MTTKSVVEMKRKTVEYWRLHLWTKLWGGKRAVKLIFTRKSLCLLESLAVELRTFSKQLQLLIVGVEGTGEVADHAQLRLQYFESPSRVEHVHEEKNVVGLVGKINDFRKSTPSSAFVQSVEVNKF